MLLIKWIQKFKFILKVFHSTSGSLQLTQKANVFKIQKCLFKKLYKCNKCIISYIQNKCISWPQIMRNVQFNTLLNCTCIVCYILIFSFFRTLLITNRAQVITFNVSCIRYVLIATAALSQVIWLVISGPLFFAWSSKSEVL